MAGRRVRESRSDHGRAVRATVLALLTVVLAAVAVAGERRGAWDLGIGRVWNAGRSADPVAATGAGARSGAAAWASAPAGSAAVPTPPVASTSTTTTTTTTGAADQDEVAGLRSRRVPDTGTGRLVTVPGSSAAPEDGSGPVHRLRVQVEGGLDVEGPAFARFVLDTLNDARSWGGSRHRVRFARTSSAGADVTVVLASPSTSAALCAPLRTYGRLSCRRGDRVVLTLYRWVHAMPGYGDDRTGYRHYVVNHEVGHWLGHGHQQCPGTGRRAPVMMQQTKGLNGCRPNPWPFPGDG